MLFMLDCFLNQLGILLTLEPQEQFRPELQPGVEQELEPELE
jgi:hypothetical protein